MGLEQHNRLTMWMEVWPELPKVRTLTLTLSRLKEIRDPVAVGDFLLWVKMLALDMRSLLAIEVLDESGTWLVLHSRTMVTRGDVSLECGSISGYVAPTPFPATMLRHLEWVEHWDSFSRRHALEHPGNPSE